MLEHPSPVGEGGLGRPLFSRQDLANGGGFVLFLDCGECLADDVFWQAARSKFPRDAQPTSTFDSGGRTDVGGRDTAVVEQAGCGQILDEGVDSLGLVFAIEQLLAEFAGSVVASREKGQRRPT
jgi:hypothetical protein